MDSHAAPTSPAAVVLSYARLRSWRRPRVGGLRSWGSEPGRRVDVSASFGRLRLAEVRPEVLARDDGAMGYWLEPAELMARHLRVYLPRLRWVPRSPPQGKLRAAQVHVLRLHLPCPPFLQIPHLMERGGFSHVLKGRKIKFLENASVTLKPNLPEDDEG